MAREDFQVTPQMVDEVVRRLRAHTSLPDSVVNGGRGLIAQELGYEAARYVFGRPAEFRRRVHDDRQIQHGLTFVHRARTPQDLLSLLVTSGPSRNQ